MIKHRVGPTFRAVVRQATRGRLLGIEREYEVRLHGSAVDARTLWPQLSDLGVHLDPGDPHARRGPTGAVLTIDGPHAEVATPPVVLRPGCTTEGLALAAAGAGQLARHLRPYDLVGYSTHLSVQVPDSRVVEVAHLLAHQLALPLMLALDRPDSPGLLVRPRPNRVEIGGEYVAGDQLRVALVLTAAMVRLAEHSGPIRSARVRALPTARVVRAVERFGWFVDRAAFGADLYDGGRGTPVGTGTAGDVLGRAWSLSRDLVVDSFAEDEIRAVDAAVEGTRPIPLEQVRDLDGPTPPVRTDRCYLPRQRGDVMVAVVLATWWRAVLEIRGPQRTRWLTVPGRALDAVLDAVAAGDLDRDLTALVGGPERSRSARAGPDVAGRISRRFAGTTWSRCSTAADRSASGRR